MSKESRLHVSPQAYTEWRESGHCGRPSTLKMFAISHNYQAYVNRIMSAGWAKASARQRDIDATNFLNRTTSVPDHVEGTEHG